MKGSLRSVFPFEEVERQFPNPLHVASLFEIKCWESRGSTVNDHRSRGV